MKTWITPALASAVVVGWFANARAAADGSLGKGTTNGSKAKSRSAARTETGSANVQGDKRSESWRLSRDGTVERTLARGGGRHTETGAWWISKKGKVCVKWPNEYEKHCGLLVSTENGGYELKKKEPEKSPFVPTKVKR